jgi:putative SOS response-associated peptidase YedK
MCNLYSVVRPRDEMARAFRVFIDCTANQPPLPAVFPDQLAPIVRFNSAGERIMESLRWGFPPPPNVGSRKALRRAEVTMRWAEQQTLVPGMEAADAMRAVQQADQIRRLLERVKRKKKAPGVAP